MSQDEDIHFEDENSGGFTKEELRQRLDDAQRATRPERPSVPDFFSLPAVRRGHWHCHRCAVINRRDEPRCCSCGDTYESIVGVVPEAELQALHACA